MATYRPADISDPSRVGRDSPVESEGPFTKVIFGPGTAQGLSQIVAGLGGSRPAILCTPGRSSDAEAIAASLSGKPIVIADAVMHTPVAVSEKAAEFARSNGADLLVSIGGGSAIGLGKALVKRLGLTHVALPTTYAGSEITPILGESEKGDKLTSRDDSLRPAVVVYDPDLIAGLPPLVAAASGINALAHSAEALTTSDDPDIVLAARRSIAIFADALPRIVADPSNAAARTDALYAAWLAAFCLAEAPMALHHKLCHALGGAFETPHAQTHAALLPHTIGYNLPACPDAAAAMQAILGDDPAGALFDLVAGLGLPTKLSQLGLPEDGIELVARRACANPYANPRPFNEEAITELLRNAWLGLRPVQEVNHA